MKLTLLLAILSLPFLHLHAQTDSFGSSSRTPLKRKSQTGSRSKLNAEQTAILEDYDFDSGGYTLLIIPDPYQAVDIFSQEDVDGAPVYFDQVDRLNQLKKDLVLDEYEGKISHYIPTFWLILCKQGRFVEHIDWYNEFDTRMSSPKGEFLFLGDFDFSGYRLARSKWYDFGDITEARKTLDSLKNDPSLIYMTPPGWDEFPGQFSVEISPVDTLVPAPLDEYEAKIRAAHPGEPFRLSLENYASPEDPGIWLLVQCNPSLYQDFNAMDQYHTEYFHYPLYLHAWLKQ
jgi:hypothetical protein